VISAWLLLATVSHSYDAGEEWGFGLCSAAFLAGFIQSPH
jgi:hypothetical protein